MACTLLIGNAARERYRCTARYGGYGLTCAHAYTPTFPHHLPDPQDLLEEARMQYRHFLDINKQVSRAGEAGCQGGKRISTIHPASHNSIACGPALIRWTVR